jgi:hypothetical protein
MKITNVFTSGNPEFKKWQGLVKGIVEATDFERNCLWQMYAIEGAKFSQLVSGTRIPWSPRQDYGVLTSVDGPGTCISVTIIEVNGRPILFYHDTSQLVNHKNIDKWFADAFPGVPKVDAANFFNVFR